MSCNVSHCCFDPCVDALAAPLLQQQDTTAALLLLNRTQASSQAALGSLVGQSPLSTFLTSLSLSLLIQVESITGVATLGRVGLAPRLALLLV
jgi:hypothetical protein